MTENGLDPSALRAVAELLQAAERHGIGVTFVPDVEDWRIGYMVGHGGGDLVAGYHLTDTARAALRGPPGARAALRSSGAPRVCKKSAENV